MTSIGSSGVVLYRKPLPPSGQYLKTSSTKTSKKTGALSLSNNKRREPLEQDIYTGRTTKPTLHTPTLS